MVGPFSIRSAIYRVLFKKDFPPARFPWIAAGPPHPLGGVLTSNNPG